MFYVFIFIWNTFNLWSYNSEDSILQLFFHFLFLSVGYVCICSHVCMRISTNECRDQRITFRSWFSPSPLFQSSISHFCHRGSSSRVVCSELSRCFSCPHFHLLLGILGLGMWHIWLFVGSGDWTPDIGLHSCIFTCWTILPVPPYFLRWGLLLRLGVASSTRFS